MNKSVSRSMASVLLLGTMLLTAQHQAFAARGARPPLASLDQIAAEKLALKILADPQVQTSEAGVRTALVNDPAAATAEGRASLDHAVSLWAAALTMREIAGDPERPAILWATEDTPHSWFGHQFPGMGGSGDNPDNIYRGTFLDGAHSYEIRGHVPTNRPVQFSIELIRGAPGKVILTGLRKGHVDLGNQLGILTDRTIQTDAHGNFVVTIDATPANGRANHLQTQSGPLEITIRNTLSDWHQTPTTLAIRRVDGGSNGQPLTEAEIARRVSADLPGFVAAWAKFNDGWLGRPPVNTLAGPLPRDGGWGFLAGGTYKLADDEALVVTTTNGGARYTGLQVTDGWALAPDSRAAFTSRNISQVAQNPDGSVTYVISPQDPGVYNWLSTSGFHQGFLVFRWQQTPGGVKAADLVRSCKVVKLSDLKSVLPSQTRWVTASERAADLKQRAADYGLRLGVRPAV